MPQRMRRKNQGLQDWLGAVAIGGLLLLALTSMHFDPVWLAVLAALIVGGAAFANAELGVLLALITLSIPIAASNPLVAICFVVVAFSMERFLGSDGGRVFLLVALAVLGAWLGPVWAAPALAGVLMGPAEGALAAALACATVELWGLVTGRAALGVTVTGGASSPLLSFVHAPTTLLSGRWLVSSFGSISGAKVSALFGTVSHANHVSALLLQPVIWALGAVVAGVVGRRAGAAHNRWLSLAAVGLGVIAIAAQVVLTSAMLSLPTSSSALAIAVVSSLIAGLALAALFAWVFPLEPIVVPPVVRRSSMATEDADVDELLRLIATAEDKLATEHTSTRVVLITDMKSFSRMTEEDGSVVSAKAIQRHRDLLIPIITRHGGCGKSTGGDGVVAAFESAAAATQASIEAQTALAEHNVSHVDEREVHVRMGLAAGEVVLDKGGRPFIGSGLNLAARVMNLADGDQILATGDVAAAVGQIVSTHSFGEFELKNIARPVELVEILWDPERPPHDPRTAPDAEA